MDNSNIKVSIVTVTYNSEQYLKRCIESVKNQKYSNIEYIIIDGHSKDRTLEIIDKYYKQGIINKYISEPDNGIYDAMNKGIDLASGEVIALLNSDDEYFDENTIERISNLFGNDIDFVYGDVVYIRKNNRYFRYWKTGELNLKKIRYGWQIPHPAFFVRTNIAKEMKYNLNYKIASDFDFILRIILKYRKYRYVSYPLVKMRFGGKSTKNVSNMKKGNEEIKNILIKNNIKPSKLYYFYRMNVRLTQILNTNKYLKRLEV